MIFWSCVGAYALIGLVVGRLTYNDSFDSAYEDALFLAHKKLYNTGEEEKQKWAYKEAKREDGPKFWGWFLGIGWPIALPVLLTVAIAHYGLKAVDKILPKSKAKKAMKVIEEAEKRAAIEAEFQKSLKIVEEYNK